MSAVSGDLIARRGERLTTTSIGEWRADAVPAYKQIMPVATTAYSFPLAPCSTNHSGDYTMWVHSRSSNPRRAKQTSPSKSCHQRQPFLAAGRRSIALRVEMLEDRLASLRSW